MEKSFMPGDEVYIVERDAIGHPCDITGCMFLAKSNHCVVCTAYINDLTSAEDTLEYHVEKTTENFDTDLLVFYAKDCYATWDEASAVLMAEGGEGTWSD